MSVPEKKKKIQALVDAFLRSVDIVCCDVGLIVFRLDFQIMTNELNCGEVITNLMKSHCADFFLSL